jgi:hypothetical protein
MRKSSTADPSIPILKERYRAATEKARRFNEEGELDLARLHQHDADEASIELEIIARMTRTART